MTYVPLLVNKSQKELHLEPNSGMCVREINEMAVLKQITERVTMSIHVELNRAVALSMAFGPEVGLEVIDSLMHEPSMKNYHLLPSVRGDFLMKLGRKQEACLQFKRAAALARNDKERELLLKRASDCAAE